MIVTPATLAELAGRPVNDNMRSAIAGLVHHSAGLELPHRLALFLGQTGEESELWQYDHELWGPTPAQLSYEGRRDLGNTEPGDGFKFRGRGPMEMTGRANYAFYTAWAKGIDPAAPDFTTDPDALTTDPWEGLSAVWFWADVKKLNPLADQGDIAAITLRINGGYNGLAERIRLSVAASLLLLGFATIRAFQGANGLDPDGDAGHLTQGLLHKMLVAAPPVSFAMGS